MGIYKHFKPELDLAHKYDCFYKNYDEEKGQKTIGRLEEVIEFLEENDDETGLNLVNRLVRDCHQYIAKVCQMEVIVEQNQQGRLECFDYQEKVSELDRSRRLKHEALMSQLTATNRYLFRNYEPIEEVPVGGVYGLAPETLSPMDRNAVADWAGHVVLGLIKFKK